jgi:CubicO group peptidase (beta-lactamase class C family)
MKPIIALLTTLFITINVYSQSLERRLDSLLQGHVNKGEIHGCLAYVFQKGNVIINKPYGYMDLENKRLMEKDAIFRIASMIKIFTAAAALKLYEEGKFLLDEPVKKYIPEFANLRVISPECKSEDSLITLPLERDVTIRDLCRHTAGFGYGGDDIIGRLHAKKKISTNSGMTLKQFVMEITSVPLKYQPGSKWEYSYANDVLGYLIEVISKEPLDIYMDEAIFKPLRMTNTGFYVTHDKLNRLCNYYGYIDNRLVLIDKAETSKFAERPICISGGSGGVSTAEDYSKFCQMLLNYGEYNGKRILSRQTVELLTSDQIGEIKDRSFLVNGFGFGVGVNPAKYCGGTSSCYWAGAPYNNTYMFDYGKHMVAILFIQNSPWRHLGLMDKFDQIVIEETKE